MTNREFITEKLNKGKTIWRFTKSAAISYTKTNNGVWCVKHYGMDECRDETISMRTAIDRLVRNFKQIDRIS